MSAPRWSDPGVHLAPLGLRPEDLGPFPAGTAVAVCRLGPRPTKASLLRAVAEALALPEWFGHNWDALLDSLTDRAGPTVLIVDGLAALDDATALTFVEVAASAALRVGRGPAPLAVVLTEPPAPDPLD